VVEIFTGDLIPDKSERKKTVTPVVTKR